MFRVETGESPGRSRIDSGGFGGWGLGEESSVLRPEMLCYRYVPYYPFMGREGLDLQGAGGPRAFPRHQGYGSSPPLQPTNAQTQLMPRIVLYYSGWLQ